jgi:hypothetical protein
VVQSLWALSNNIFWGTLDIDSNKVLTSLNLSDNNFSLKVLIEWKLYNFWSKPVSINENILDVFLVVHEELDKTNFDRLSFWDVFAFLFISFNSNISVWDDTFLDNLLKFLLEFKFRVEKLWCFVVVRLLFVSDLNSWNCNLWLSEGSSLTYTYIMEHCTCLDTRKILYQNVVFL